MVFDREYTEQQHNDMRNMTKIESGLGLKHILLREDALKSLKALPAIKQRLESGNYASQVVKAQERQFVDELEAKIEVAKWVDERYESLQPDNGRLSMPISLPRWNPDKREYTLFEGKLYVSRSVENYVNQRLNIGTDYDWIMVSHDVFGSRLDWNPILFADILRNQGRMDEWCKEMHESKRAIGVYGY